MTSETSRPPGEGPTGSKDAAPDAQRRRLLGLIAKGGYTAPIALTMLSATPARASSVTPSKPWKPKPWRPQRPWWWWWWR